MILCFLALGLLARVCGGALTGMVTSYWLLFGWACCGPSEKKNVTSGSLTSASEPYIICIPSYSGGSVLKFLQLTFQRFVTITPNERAVTKKG